MVAWSKPFMVPLGEVSKAGSPLPNDSRPEEENKAEGVEG